MSDNTKQSMVSCAIHCGTNMARDLIGVAELLYPIVPLAIRLWMASVFWKSGMLKVTNWDTTLFLFTEEHPVPLLPPEIAAFSAVSFELLCPVLLLAGFASRLATLPMLAMTAVIQFTYLQHTDHLYWALLLSVILFAGPGKLSIDYFIRKKFLPQNN